MDERLVRSCEEFLSLLPESNIYAKNLAFALASFNINGEQVNRAAEKLPGYHDLRYKGIRMLISEYIKKFCEIFIKDDRRLRCEVTVPAPLFLIMAYQNAGEGKWRISTDALIAQIVLRSFFLYEVPLSGGQVPMRYCGLNRMRVELIDYYDCLMQFGVLCDECLKCGEANGDRIKTLSVSYPKGSDTEQHELISDLTVGFISECDKALDLTLNVSHKKTAVKQYARLIKVQNALLTLNRRTDRLPLKGNSFALVQSVQLTVFDNWNRAMEALEILAEELETAPLTKNTKRVYCFYTPFLQPQIDERFYQNGIQLMGSAVFLHHSSRISFSMEEMVVDWLFGMNVRDAAVTESEYIADEIKENGCCAYLTGMYSFDRWMGPSALIHSQILEQHYGFPTFFLDVDFWEGGSDLTERIETICSVLNQRK